MNKTGIAGVVFILVIILNACTLGAPINQPDLQGTSWVLTACNQISPLEGTRVTLNFEDDVATGHTGCNIYSGDYRVNGEAISIGPLVQTEMGCFDPEGIMDQERTYLNILGAAQTFYLADGTLTIIADQGQILAFQTPSSTVQATSPPIMDLPGPISPTPTQDNVNSNSQPPAGFKEYLDPEVGISVFIPKDWVVFEAIEGDYAVFTSYPEDKYIGGEGREPGDTKCDLNLHPSFTGNVMDLINQWKSASMTTILSEDEVILDSGYPGRRIERDNRGQSISMVTEINNRVISLTCWGEFKPFDEIAVTLKASE